MYGNYCLDVRNCIVCFTDGYAQQERRNKPKTVNVIIECIYVDTTAFILNKWFNK